MGRRAGGCARLPASAGGACARTAVGTPSTGGLIGAVLDVKSRDNVVVACGIVGDENFNETWFIRAHDRRTGAIPAPATGGVVTAGGVDLTLRSLVNSEISFISF